MSPKRGPQHLRLSRSIWIVNSRGSDRTFGGTETYTVVESSPISAESSAILEMSLFSKPCSHFQSDFHTPACQMRPMLPGLQTCWFDDEPKFEAVAKVCPCYAKFGPMLTNSSEVWRMLGEHVRNRPTFSETSSQICPNCGHAFINFDQIWSNSAHVRPKPGRAWMWSNPMVDSILDLAGRSPNAVEPNFARNEPNLVGPRHSQLVHGSEMPHLPMGLEGPRGLNQAKATKNMTSTQHQVDAGSTHSPCAADRRAGSCIMKPALRPATYNI